MLTRHCGSEPSAGGNPSGVEVSLRGDHGGPSDRLATLQRTDIRLSDEHTLKIRVSPYFS